MKLLIVDDDQVIHLTFTKPLINSGHEVFNAYDGQEALDMALKHKPDIIILDVTMPQGLGLGSLYTNNLPSPLEMERDSLWHRPGKRWDLQVIGGI